MNIGYIYLITNKINNKKYVGQTIMTVHTRWLKHCSVAKNQPHVIGIDGAIRKYGEENFSIQTIKECPIAELDQWEKYYIQYYETYQGNNKNKGYNITLGGQPGYIYDIDEDEMLQMYLEGKTTVELASYYNCSDRTIVNRLSKYNVDTKEHQKRWLQQHSAIWENNLRQEVGRPFQKGDNTKAIYLIELDKTFNSLEECSKWLLNNGYTKATSWEAVRKSLSRHLHGERDSYLKMHFVFL